MTPEETDPAQIRKPPDAITIWTICNRPPDYPQGYILRVQFTIQLPTVGVVDVSPFGELIQVYSGAVARTGVVLSPLMWHAKTFDELESILPPWVTRISPQPGDPAYLEGVWLE